MADGESPSIAKSGSQLKVLIVAFYFPPFDSIAALRAGKLAKYLCRFGHDVRVLSASPQESPFATLPVEIPIERVGYSRWLGLKRLRSPRAALERSSRESSSRLPFRATLGRVVRATLQIPDPQAGWYPFAVREGGRMLRSWTPDVVFATSGPPTALLIGKALARRAGVPWVADFRDLWSENQAYDLPGWRRRLDRWAERRVLDTAAALTTVSEPLAERLRVWGKPVHVLLNGFDPRDFAAERGAGSAGHLSIVYTGTIYSGRQSPEPLFAAIARMGPSGRRIRVVFIGAPAASIAPQARAHGVAEQIEIQPLRPYTESLRAQRNADVLLHLLWTDKTQPGVYNAKVFEYLGARRPILAVGPPSNVTGRLVAERSAGIASESAEEIAAQLDRWLAEKDSRGEIADLPPQVAAGLTREDQARVLETILRSTVAAAGAAA